MTFENRWLERDVVFKELRNTSAFYAAGSSYVNLHRLAASIASCGMPCPVTVKNPTVVAASQIAAV